MALLERGEERSAGGVLLIEGGAGIGKTALVEAACATARVQGSEVVRAQAAELEAGFAFGVVRQLFERRLLGSSHAEREQLLAGPAGAAWTLLGDFFGRYHQLSEGTLRVVPQFLADGERVVVLCTVSAQRHGRAWWSPEVHVWRMVDGCATEFVEYQGDQQAEDEFWTSSS